jgi:hypothetical protein
MISQLGTQLLYLVDASIGGGNMSIVLGTEAARALEMPSGVNASLSPLVGVYRTTERQL